jgi:hypothetical protein
MNEEGVCLKLGGFNTLVVLNEMLDPPTTLPVASILL